MLHAPLAVQLIQLKNPLFQNLCWKRNSHPFPASPEFRLGPDPLKFLGLDAPDVTGFRPSGHRAANAVRITAATGLQPRGRALPALVPKGLSPDQHWQHACFHTFHPMSLLPKLPPKLLLAARRLHSMGSTVVEFRQDQRGRMRHLARELDAIREDWRQSLHPQVRKIVGGWHMPLIHVLAFEAGSQDLFFALDNSLGVSIVGRAMHSFVMPLRITRPIITVAEMEQHALQRNQLLLQSVRSSGDTELDEANYAKTKQELASGIMLGPWSADQLPRCLKVVSRRFPIWERHGGQRDQEMP